MSFCTNCGNSVQGAFCPNCGSPVKPAAGAAPAAASPPMMTPLSPPTPAPVARKGASPLVWILGIFFGLAVLGGLAFVVGGIFLVHKVKQAGLDPDLLKRNPAVAVTKMLAAVNPDVSVVSVDEGKGLVTLRDRHTGQTVTLSFEDIQKGKIKFEADGKQATIEARGDGQSGTLEIKGPDGSMQFGSGANAKVPEWIPSYPGASAQGTFSMNANQEEGGTFQFTTRDSVKAVIAFYEEKLPAAGFKITSQATGDGAESSGGMLSAENADQKRSVVVTLGTSGGETTVNVLFGVKK